MFFNRSFLAPRVAQWIGSITMSDLFGLFCMHLLLPGAILLEYLVILPKGRHASVTWAYDLNFYAVWFLTFSMYSNYYLIIINHSRVSKNTVTTLSTRCNSCNTYVPPRAWHCNVCKTCILNRDHHCYFTATCIGHNNQRYFLCFVFYVWLSITYAVFVNLFIFMDYVRLHPDLNTWIEESYKYIGYHVLGIDSLHFRDDLVDFKFDSMSAFVFAGWIGYELLCIVFHYFVSMLLLYSLVTLYKGCPPCRSQQVPPSTEFMRNIRTMLGHRWYLVLICAFIPSQLYHDGYSYTKQGRRDLDLEKSNI